MTLRPIGTWDSQWDTALRDLLRNLSLERPRAAKTFPEWDLALVLRCLMRSPFEPLQAATVRNLTYKTVFLLSLASSHRRSEIHAIAFKHTAFSRGDGSAYLTTYPEFLSKTQRPHASREPIKIPALAPTLDRDLPDRNLCPVRALKYYVERSKRPFLRRERKKLFLPLRESNPREITAATISQWVKATVKQAYELTGQSEELKRLAGIRTHELRALSTSWAFEVGTSLEMVLQAGRWRSQSCFSDFYLRNCVDMADGMCALGPVVAAQQVCHPPSRRPKRN